jgi:hypothetical protein
MKHFSLSLSLASVLTLGIALAVTPLSARAQATAVVVGPAGLQLGGTINFLHPDTTATVVGHASNAGIIAGAEDIGGSFYANYDLTEHLGATFEANFPTYHTPDDYLEKSYLIGARYTQRINKFEVYGKFLVGLAQTSYDYPVPWIVYPGSTGSFGDYAFGGGLDYHLLNHLNIRAFDYEFQLVPGASPNGLKPQIISIGAAYRFR